MRLQPGEQTSFPWLGEFQPELAPIDNTPEPLLEFTPDPEAIGLHLVASYKVKP